MMGKNLAGVIARRHAVASLNETEHCSDRPTRLHILHYGGGGDDAADGDRMVNNH